jgi:malate/lactate dehydrogenase
MPASLKISIIGTGQIGSRHLQALSHLKEVVQIQLVDPSQNFLETACQRFHSCNKEDSKRIILQSLD